MKLITIHKLEKLLEQEPIEKHLKEFHYHKYPEALYKCWLKGLIEYLTDRYKRSQASKNT